MFSSSMFGQILKLLPHERMGKIVAKYDSDRYAKRFKTRDQLVAMLAMQFSGATSLRELEVLFAANRGCHYHLHCHDVKRSTLADANARRSADMFGEIAAVMVAAAGRKGRKLKPLLSILDSTPIRLAGRGHQWAEASRSRAGNQGLKLHLLMTPKAGGIDYVQVTDMTVNDITEARNVTLESGRIYLFDKAYCDYDWWWKIIQSGADFVTRLKKNAAFTVVEERILDGDPWIVSDKIIMLTNRAPRAGKHNPMVGVKLRLVEVNALGCSVRIGNRCGG